MHVNPTRNKFNVLIASKMNASKTLQHVSSTPLGGSIKYQICKCSDTRTYRMRMM